ncbi:_thioesterase family [Lichtheimia corymbifera JMRC:FSU:9682]|uniref:_thioesterase family n=1 Tax=Lichtheimia corymbifera JMRC:FSU:9682 TaxID=1263082 RepID=A0A068S540_9FUNG|nr:_thioesterase family [Lichtheimia corymbifera JMRC:FSU:9682]
MLPTTVLRSPALVQKVLKSFHTEGGYDSLVLPGLKVINSEEGRVRAEFTVEKQHLNRLKSVHGGLLATVLRKDYMQPVGRIAVVTNWARHLHSQALSFPQMVALLLLEDTTSLLLKLTPTRRMR